MSALPDHPRRRAGDRVARAAVYAVTSGLLGPAAIAIVAALRADRSSSLAAGGLVLAAFLVAGLLGRGGRRRTEHLQVLRVAFPTLVALTATAACIALTPLLHIHGLNGYDWLLVSVVAAASAILRERVREETRAARPLRVAFVGSAESAWRLRADLDRTRQRSYMLAGRIEPDVESAGGPPALGTLGDLRDAVLREQIDLLVFDSTVGRLAVFEAVAATCLDLGLRVTESSDFYEDVFGHVATDQINAAWFAQLVDARAHHPSPGAKRALDVAVALVFGILTLPLMALLALLVQLDGGPAIFAQRRVGEAGRPFRLYKLRTMRVGAGAEGAWAQERDPRTTRVGRLMRRTHVDELPQLWNVLRGEMSFVGPRPEQLGYVEQLERALPFYQRRHLIRPGLTGWAQVRCGYAGTELGAAWKLCNDLYYVKHRSLGLDVLLLAETAVYVLLGTADPDGPAFVSWAGADELLAEVAPAGWPPAPFSAPTAAPGLPVVAMSSGDHGQAQSRPAA